MASVGLPSCVCPAPSGLDLVCNYAALTHVNFDVAAHFENVNTDRVTTNNWRVDARTDRRDAEAAGGDQNPQENHWNCFILNWDRRKRKRSKRRERG